MKIEQKKNKNTRRRMSESVSGRSRRKGGRGTFVFYGGIFLIKSIVVRRRRLADERRSPDMHSHTYTNKHTP